MLRVQIVTLLLLSLGAVSYGQKRSEGPVFKNGRLRAENSVLGRDLSHRLWQSVRFGSDYYVVVQLDGNPDPVRKSDLLENGIRLEQWIGSNSWLATCKAGFIVKNSQRAGVKNIYVIPPALKIDRRLKESSVVTGGSKDLIVVTCFPGDREQIEKSLRESGVKIVETKIKPANTWFLKAGPAAIEKLSKLPFISSISPIHLEDVPLNYNNHAIHSVQSLSATVGRNLSGKNLIIGIGDNANPSDHIDLAGKLIMRTDEPIDYHGTHTSGIIAGGGIINPMYAGMAPRSHLVVNDFSNIIVNSPAYVKDFNMPLTNNSYYNGSAGCTGDGEYNILSYYIDSQLLAYPRLLHVFAVGNDGAFTCSPFPPGFATVKSGFQTAKNILSVGSMNNVVYTIGGGSSHGPTSDGRIKPELVAGGIYITSTIPGNLYDAYIGTSMASPTVAGILGLITERYKQLHGGDNPDGALLKALAINNAVDLGNPGPDFTFGFGMISGRPTVEALEQNHYFTGTISNGQSLPFTIPSVATGGYQLKVLLYWPDVPASPVASVALVNDLDLTVSEPGGTVHLPMVLDPSAANVNNNAVEGPDHRNNIEQVLVNNPPPGNYTLTVKGDTIPYGPQKFYLTYEWLPASVSVEYPFGSETWVPGQAETLRWSAYGGEPNGFTIEYSIDGGSNWITIDNAVPATDRSYIWTVPSVFTNNALIRITRNSTGYSDTSDYPFTILNQPALTVTNTCPGYAQLQWNTVAGADSYDIMKLSADSMQVIGHTTDTVWLVTPLNKDSSYWFSVRASRAGIYGRRAVGQNIIPNSGPCTAPALANDLFIDSLLAPVSGRQFTASQPGNQRISISVKNPGPVSTSAPVSYSFQVNGGAIVTEVSSVVIPANSNTVFTFSPANSYDFSAAGSYSVKTWIHYTPDTIPANDTLFVNIKNLRNDPLVLNPSFVEGFESAANQTYNRAVLGLDSLDRADFSNSSANGRLNSFFNSGFARSGIRSILLDVTAQGTNAADSLTNTFNLSNYSPSDQLWLDIYFKKQSNVAALPGNQVWIRGNDQAAWIPVKSLGDLLDPPGKYIKLNLDVTGILAAAIPAQTISSSFQVRCGTEGKTPAASSDPMGLPGGGISFDDFMITKSQHDVGMRKLVQPGLKNICALSNAEKITVVIRNYSTDSLQNIPVSYAINQDTVTELLPSLAPRDSIQYTFNKTADMSVFQTYYIKTWVNSPTDNYRNNDSSGDYSIQTTPLVSNYPYLEGFENNNGYWYSGGQNNSWQWGSPLKQVIHKAANGKNAWVTSLTGNYNDNEYSYLYSPCFDLSGLTKPVLSFSHIFQTEDNCDCDFHWVEYSLNDSSWTILGNATTGVNWYDNATKIAWQKSASSWHVSSYDIPVNPAKIRFRFVMFSDPGSNYEGIGIDDVHLFEKAPVFTDSLVTTLTQPVSGSNWIDFEENGHKIISIQPNGQNLGNIQLVMYRDSSAIRDTAGQYYGSRNWVLQTATPVVSDVHVRYYFTDSEANKLIHAGSCPSCLNIEDAYSTGITQYSSASLYEEDSSLRNNRLGNYIFHKPQSEVQVIPYDNGYYAETTVKGFSEFWLNGGGKNQDHPLAAWLKDFTAVASGVTGLLDWSSWQDAGSVKYVIERRTDSSDFNTIGELPIILHSDSTQAYHFTDPRLADGNNYYRLVLHLQNGDSLFSPVRQIFYEPVPAYVQVYPNPLISDITIKTPSPCREMQIFDVLGRKLLERSCQGYFQHLSLGKLPRGVYFLKLFTDSGNKLIKLEKR